MAEKYTIVDEKDNSIGSKQKDEINRNDIYRVASLWVVNAQGQILLAKRAFGKRNNPGKWMPVAVSGTVEEHETYEQNIIKETDEELGINLKDHPYKLIYTGLMDGNHKFYLHVFGTTIDLPLEAIDFDRFETSEVQWFDKDELLKLLEEQPKLFTPNAGILIPNLMQATK